jgi:hypothetical protein
MPPAQWISRRHCSCFDVVAVTFTYRNVLGCSQLCPHLSPKEAKDDFSMFLKTTILQAYYPNKLQISMSSLTGGKILNPSISRPWHNIANMIVGTPCVIKGFISRIVFRENIYLNWFKMTETLVQYSQRFYTLVPSVLRSWKLHKIDIFNCLKFNPWFIVFEENAQHILKLSIRILRSASATLSSVCINYQLHESY